MRCGKGKNSNYSTYSNFKTISFKLICLVKLTLSAINRRNKMNATKSYKILL